METSEDSEVESLKSLAIIKNGVMEMPVSEAKRRADARYDKKTYDHVLVKIRKDSDLTLAMIKEHAGAMRESTNGFIVRAIRETVERDKVKIES